MAVNFEVIFDTLAKILCLLVILGQAVALDSYFFTLDHSGGSPYVWVVWDVLILICWALSLLLPTCFSKQLSAGHGHRSWIMQVVNELKYAYLSWIFYAIVLCVKLNHLFFYIAEQFSAEPPPYSTVDPDILTTGAPEEPHFLISSTSVKLLISLAGVAFLLLVYSHHNEIKEENYKQVMEKISLSACLDILDCLMLLNILFIDDSGLVLPYRLDKTVRAFACICILLPVFPLLVLRVLQHPTANLKWYQLSIITQTSLYFLLVNIPLFSIRLHLWIKHDADISTFFTKNVIMLFKGAIDIVKSAYSWYKDSKKLQEGGHEDEEGHGDIMLKDTNLSGGAGEKNQPERI